MSRPPARDAEPSPKAGPQARAGTSPKAKAAAERRARLAAELRANLRKRKARGRADCAQGGQPPEVEGES